MNVGGVLESTVSASTKDAHPISDAVAKRGKCRDWEPGCDKKKEEVVNEHHLEQGEFDPENQSINFIGNL